MRKLRVWGDRDFMIEVPDDAKVTFGPFSPPPVGGYKLGGPSGNRGTLRIYKGTKTTENVVAVFSGVEGFRDESLYYEEELSKPIAASAVTFRAPWGEMDDDERKEFTSEVAEAIMEKTVAKVAKEDDDGPEREPEPPF